MLIKSISHFYIIEGAIATTRVKFFPLNSSVIGYKIRVPNGLLSLFISTARFSPNETVVPSKRFVFFFVAIITALQV
jgi:hypothetical protein